MAAFFSFGMISCGGESEEASSDESISVTDCNKWLDDYESRVDDYLAIIKKYEANPTDTTIMLEYTSITQKVGAMVSSYPEDCAGDAAFLARQKKIADKMTTAGGM